MKVDQERKQILDAGFAAAFADAPERYFSAPGRTEIGGNHTDHQRGCVLAAAVNLDCRAAVKRRDSDCIRIQSEGYPRIEIALSDLAPKGEEKNTSAALLRGVAAGLVEKGVDIGGFDAYITSSVLPGAGLSSSAALEVLLGTVINSLFFENALPAAEIAKIGQHAENVYFGKPCGLMDQMAAAVGNLVAIDFKDADAPVVTPIDFDFSACGYALCMIDTKGNHTDLTDAYAAIPMEMKAVSAYFGKEVLREVSEAEFYRELVNIQKACGDRAVLRAMHFFAENKRVGEEVAALQEGDFAHFLSLVNASGRSSWMYLQNVIDPRSGANQNMAFALALCDKLLGGEGACRVHGGGFAGTVQAFVPQHLLAAFTQGIEAVLGAGTCHVLSIRPTGGVELEP